MTARIARTICWPRAKPSVSCSRPTPGACARRHGANPVPDNGAESPMTTTSPATEEDRRFFQRELESFLPQRVFDAHAHVWRKEAVTWPLKGLPPEVGYKEYRALMEDLHPRRRTAA